MYRYGGINFCSYDIDGQRASSELWALNVHTNQWLSLDGLVANAGQGPGGRQSHSAVLHGGFMWVFGGMTRVKEPVDNHVYRMKVPGTFEELRASTLEWQRVKVKGGAGNRPSPRSDHRAIAYRGKMYVFGGKDRGEQTCRSDLWEFNFAANKWRLLHDGKDVVPRYCHAMFAANGDTRTRTRIHSRNAGTNNKQQTTTYNTQHTNTQG